MRIIAPLVILILVMVCLAGCGRKERQAPSVDLTQLEKLFANGSEEDREILRRAAEWIREPDYVKALTELEKINDRSDLDPRQQIALKTAIIRVQDAITRESSAASSAATNAK